MGKHSSVYRVSGASIVISNPLLNTIYSSSHGQNRGRRLSPANASSRKAAFSPAYSQLNRVSEL